MEHNQLLPLVVAVIALLGGMFAGMRLHRFSWASRLKPYAIAAVILALLLGGYVSGWLTGILMVAVSSRWEAALISVSLLSFFSGALLALCGSPSDRKGNSSQRQK